MEKQHILDEIQRTAAQNGGAPLGRLRFEAETGIRESDWRGVHWARWNDAVREAGLEPNELTSAYDEAVLFGKLVTLAREIGRFPTYTEIRLRSRNDDTFPSDKTYGKIGSKAELAKAAAEFCRQRPEYSDVLALCEAASGPPKAQEQRTKLTDTVFGHVYLMKSGKHYKIGRSNSASRRHYELAIQLPDKLKTVHVMSTDDPEGIEAYWHKRFATKRLNGEWFNLAAEDVAAFRRRKFM